MAVESLHENRGILGPEILGRHRVISTLMKSCRRLIGTINEFRQRQSGVPGGPVCWNGCADMMPASISS
jgi:hypothetical protein